MFRTILPHLPRKQRERFIPRPRTMNGATKLTKVSSVSETTVLQEMHVATLRKGLSLNSSQDVNFSSDKKRKVLKSTRFLIYVPMGASLSTYRMTTRRFRPSPCDSVFTFGASESAVWMIRRS